MEKIIVRRDLSTTSAALAATDLHPLLKRIYQARGVQAQHELEKDLASLLPFNDLLNIDTAVERLFLALSLQQRILVIGDFDTDGATSSALAVSALRQFGANDVNYLVPSRFTEGYGLSPEIIKIAALDKPDLIITVDNGIASIEGVKAANQLGIEVIITDHHLPGPILPAATAIINPNQPGDKFASKNLAGVGVIFYVMLALRSHLLARHWFDEQGISKPNMAQFLDLVALGTVADLVPLDKNNRALVHEGLKRIRQQRCRPGIQALLTVANRNVLNLTTSDLGFAVAPRLNAAGRLDDMSIGISCLLAEDFSKAMILAQQLDGLNNERRVIEADMKQQAFSALNQIKLQQKHKHLPAGICLYADEWHQGVIGILAARIKDYYHRPVIAFAPGHEGEVKGSARSIPGLNIRDLLATIAARESNLIEKFGGHAMAAGLSLRRENYDRFALLFVEEVKNSLDEDSLTNRIYSDGMLAADEFSVQIAELLQEAGPWGQHFPEPLFDGVFNVLEQRLVANKHLKISLQLDSSQKVLEAIAFNIDLDRWPNQRCNRVSLAYRLGINDYNGLRRLQLIVEAITAVG